MNSGFGKYLAMFFAACFLALQCHAVGETQVEHNAKRIFHIENVTTSVRDKPKDNRFIYVQQLASKQAYLSRQTSKPKPRQFLGAIERRADHPFQEFMQECLAAICVDYQDKLITTCNYLQKLALSFEFNPILISDFKPIHNDESDSPISLS